MNKTLLFGSVLAVLASAYGASIFAKISRLNLNPHAQYELVAEFRGERFVLDSGLTLVDCFDAMPRHDPAHSFYTACELPEGN